MKDLTQSQKAQAFDALLEWLSNAAGEWQEKANKEWSDKMEAVYQGKADVLDTAAEMAVQIASQLSAQPEQAENMPPPDLDLNQHVGKTAVLWDGYGYPIKDSGTDNLFFIGGERYGAGGFFASYPNTKCLFNIKTILP